jgi:hypothetical protein
MNRPTFGSKLTNGTTILFIAGWWEGVEGLLPTAVVLCYRDWEPNAPYCVWSLVEREINGTIHYITEMGAYCATQQEAWFTYKSARANVARAYER